MSTTANPFVDSACGIFGGVCGVVVGHPQDTVKARMQTGQAAVRELSALQSLRHVLQNEGAFGLMRGVAPPCVAVAAINSILFGTYSLTSTWLAPGARELALWQVTLAGTPRSTRRHSSPMVPPALFCCRLAAGSVGGAAQLSVATPLELIKIRTQLLGAHAPIGPFRLAQQIFRLRGVRGLYRGLLALGIRDVPTYGVYFGAYEAILRSNRRWHWSSSDTLSSFVAGGLSGVLSWLSCYPLDALKTKHQSSDDARLRDVWRAMRQSGSRDIYRGLSLTLARAFIVNAVTFSLYEQSLRWLTLDGHS